MFTGLIEETGIIADSERSEKGRIITVKTDTIAGELKTGQSIAVDGCCLTVSKAQKGEFQAEVSVETLNRTYKKAFSAGRRVNLERAMRPEDRFEGHLVQGHVDGTGEVKNLKDAGGSYYLSVEISRNMLDNTVEKGSIALNGVSLTITEVESRRFIVNLISHTLEKTNLSELQPGDRVNLELDIVGKYIISFLRNSKGVDKELLREYGFMNG